jgi:hypothetical protein
VAIVARIATRRWREERVFCQFRRVRPGSVAGDETKLARNEATFRAANEKLETFATENVADTEDRLLPFLCECDRIDCTKVVLLSLPEYEEVRRDGTHSFMVNGHDNREIERVIDKNDRFIVTSKFGAAADVYEDLDPRG